MNFKYVIHGIIYVFTSCVIFFFMIMLFAGAEAKVRQDRIKYENTKYTIISKDKEYKHADHLSYFDGKFGGHCNFNYNGQEITIIGEFTIIKEKPEVEKSND